MRRFIFFRILLAGSSGLLAMPAFAADGLTATTTTTVNAPVTGGDGAAQGADAQGNPGDDGIEFGAVNITVTNNSTATGGNGSAGGPDLDSSGGNFGADGGAGVKLPLAQSGTSTSNRPVFFNGLGGVVIGGNGGAGSDGGGGNAAGGTGRNGGAGIRIDAAFSLITNQGSITGGNGAAGGNGVGTGAGGAGGVGYYGIQVAAADVTINNSGTIQGGVGAAGGSGSTIGATGPGFGAVTLATRTTLINSGTLLGGSNFGQSAVSASQDNVISNSGSILGGIGNGVSYGGGITLGGSLTNTGTISTTSGVGVTGAVVYNSGVLSLLDNSGSLTAQGGSGVRVGGGTVTLLDNSGGTISSNSGSGIWLNAPGSTITTLDNSGGTISSVSNSAINIGGQIGAIINTGGTITSGTQFTNAGAVHINQNQTNGLSIAGGTISNTNSGSNFGIGLNIFAAQSGVIASSANIVSNGTGAAQGIAVNIAANAAFTNNGTVTGRIVDANNAVAHITNNGTINGNTTVSGTGVGSSFTNDGIINGNIAYSGAVAHDFAFLSNGVMTGDLIAGGGADVVNISGGSLIGDVNLGGGANTLNVNGTFDTDGVFRASAGTLALAVGSGGVFTVEDALFDVTTIDVAAGGQIYLTTTPLIGSGNLANQGTITAAPGEFVQAATMTPGGAFVFGVDGLGITGQVVLTAGALDFTGTSIQIDAVLTNGPIAAGTTFTIGQGTAAAIGVTNGLLVADNSALLNFYLYRADAPGFGALSSEVLVQAQLALLANIASYGDDPNAVGLGGALDVIQLNGDSSIDNLMLLLAQQQTDAQINAILDSLLPETDGVAYDIATDAGDQVLDVASRRLDGLRGTSVAGLPYQVAGPGVRDARVPRQGFEVWGQAFGRIADQRRRGYNDGYDADGYGFAAGADTAFDGGRSLVGGAFAYGQTNADGDGVNRTSSDVDSTQLVLYGDHLFDNRVYAKGMLGYGWHANDIVRHDVGGVPGATVMGAYDARQVTARAEAGRAYAAGGDLTLVPYVAANYAHYDADAYVEQGVLGLSVAPESLQSLRLGAGVLARWDVALDGEVLLQPEVRAAYRRELIGDRFETTSAFVGAPGLASFRTLGVEPPRDILDLGVGALLATAGGVDIRASYDVELKDSYTAHGGYLRASVAF